MKTNTPRSGIFFLAAALALAIVLLPSSTIAQVVINTPPTVIPYNFVIDNGVILNIAEGGLIGRSFVARAGSEVNMSGGSIGNSFYTHPESSLNISGGILGANFYSWPGTSINISGGAIGYNSAFNSLDGSTTFTGGEFFLNGVEFTEDTITLMSEDIFTGTFADGSAFIFTSLVSDTLEGVALNYAELPINDSSPITVSTPITNGPSGLRSGQTMTVQTGGGLRKYFAVVSAELNIEGGFVGSGLETIQSTVNISGGIVSTYFEALEGSVVNVSGGAVRESFDARSGSIVNISGGTVGDDFRAFAGSEINIFNGNLGSIYSYPGSKINISGGNLGDHSRSYSGSEVNISGGTIGLNFYAEADSNVTLFGGEFLLNGNEYTGNTISLTDNDVFTGTLTDGSTFIFTPERFDSLEGVALTHTVLPTNELSPIIVSSPGTNGPSGLRAGQSLTLLVSGELQDNFSAVNATLNIQGGTLGSDAEVTSTTINVSGGEVASSLYTYERSVVNISGGSIASHFQAHSESVVNISGGSIATHFQAHSGSVVNISGGLISGVRSRNPSSNFTVIESLVNISDGTVELLRANEASQINISGGELFELDANLNSVINLFGGTIEELNAYSGSEVNLFGTEFMLDDVLLTTLEFGDRFIITDRDSVLTGRLLDGSLFSFNLGSNADDYFDDEAILSVTLLETGLEGDYNNDGVVDAADYTVWRDNLGSSFALINETVTPGAVTEEDYLVYVNNYGAQYAPSETSSQSIPEPATLAMLLFGCCSLLKRRC